MKYVGRVLNMEPGPASNTYNGFAVIGGLPGNSSEPYRFIPRPEDFEDNPVPFSGMIIPFINQQMPSGTVPSMDSSDSAWMSFEVQHSGTQWTVGSGPAYFASAFNDKWIYEEENAVEDPYNWIYWSAFTLSSLIHVLAGLAFIFSAARIFRIFNAGVFASSPEALAVAKMGGAGLVAIGAVYAYLAVPRKRSVTLIRTGLAYSALSLLAIAMIASANEIGMDKLIYPLALHVILLIALFMVGRKGKGPAPVKQPAKK